MNAPAPVDADALHRLAIRERIEAYSDAVFRHDAEAWIACWAEDATWSLPSLGIDLTGRPAIEAAWRQAMSAFAVAGFFATPGPIVVAGRQATARVHTQEILVGHDGKVRRILGAYDDELALQDGAWRFTRRAYRVLHDDGAEAVA